MSSFFLVRPQIAGIAWTIVNASTAERAALAVVAHRKHVGAKPYPIYDVVPQTKRLGMIGATSVYRPPGNFADEVSCDASNFMPCWDWTARVEVRA